MAYQQFMHWYYHIFNAFSSSLFIYSKILCALFSVCHFTLNIWFYWTVHTDLFFSWVVTVNLEPNKVYEKFKLFLPLCIILCVSKSVTVPTMPSLSINIGLVHKNMILWRRKKKDLFVHKQLSIIIFQWFNHWQRVSIWPPTDALFHRHHKDPSSDSPLIRFCDFIDIRGFIVHIRNKNLALSPCLENWCQLSSTFGWPCIQSQEVQLQSNAHAQLLFVLPCVNWVRPCYFNGSVSANMANSLSSCLCIGRGVVVNASGVPQLLLK